MACWKTRISYSKGDDVIHVEHFSEGGKLLSEMNMDSEGAYEYAWGIIDAADCARGVE